MLGDVLTQVQAVMAALPGISAAPVNPPGQLSAKMTAIAYPGAGENEFGVAGERKQLHDVVVEIFRPFTDLALDMAALTPYADSVPNAIMDALLTNRLGGTCSTFARISCAGIGQVEYAGKPYLRIMFTIRSIKIATAIS